MPRPKKIHVEPEAPTMDVHIELRRGRHRVGTKVVPVAAKTTEEAIRFARARVEHVGEMVVKGVYPHG